MWSWGRGESGQLGHGGSKHGSHPRRVEALEQLKVKEVACGRHCTAALMEAGELYTWGDNSYGQVPAPPSPPLLLHSRAPFLVPLSLCVSDAREEGGQGVVRMSAYRALPFPAPVCYGIA